MPNTGQGMPTLKIFGLILCLVTILGCRTNALIKSSVSASSTDSEIPDLPEWHEPKLLFISEAVLEKRPFRVVSNVLYDLSWAIKSGSDANKAIPTRGQRPSYAELQAIWERCLEAGKDFDVHGRISQSTQDGLLVLVGGPSQKKLIYLENHPDHDLLVDGESVNVWAFPSGVYRFTTITGASATV